MSLSNQQNVVSIDNLKTILDAGAKMSTITTPGTAADVLVIPREYQAVAADSIIGKFLPKPRRIDASPVFTDILSFIEYVKAFAVPETRIFLADDGKMTAIFDYHRAPTSVNTPNGGQGSPSEAAWCDHQATYNPVQTVEWKRFTGSNRQHMNQTELSEWLEENQEMIVEPLTGADLLELAQTLDGKNHIDCSSVSRLANGATRLIYSEEVSLKGTTNTTQGEMDFPSLIAVGVAPFEGVANYKVRARMRYRISNRKLEFWYDIIDPHIVLKNALDDMKKLVQEKTSIIPLLGTP